MIVGHQTWEHLLFAHYRVDDEALRAIVPKELALDLFEGDAWVTVLPFQVRQSRPIGVPAVAASMVPASDFVELNFRTYVKAPNGEGGIYFFSLDASSKLAVAGARTAYRLPYQEAEMSLSVVDGAVRFSSKRLDGPQRCEAVYRATGNPAIATAGTLDHFLVERYTLFTVDRARVGGARVRHDPYLVRGAELELWSENLLDEIGLGRPEPARLHYSERVVVDISAPFGLA